MQNRRTTTRTFRLERGILEALEKIAKRDGVSGNAVVQGLLLQRVKADPIIRAFPYIVLSRRSFAPILGMTSPDGLEIVGLDLGKRNFAFARELYESIGMELTFPNYLVDVLDKQAHWFQIEGVNTKPERMTLRHEYGMKWSLFLKSFLTAAYELISRDKLRIDTTEAYVSLQLPEAFPSRKR